MNNDEFCRRIVDRCTPLPGSTPYTNERPLSVPGRYDRYTLLDFLDAYHPHIGRENWSDRIEAGLITVNGKSAGFDDIVRGGNQLINRIENTVEPTVSLALRLLLMDPALVVLEKPAPLPLHPCGRFNKNTLTHLLARAFPEEAFHLVHRLDAETTGVLLLARTAVAARVLQKQFENHQVEKAYCALVRGVPEPQEFLLEQTIGKHSTTLGKRAIAGHGQKSCTTCQVVAVNEAEQVSQLQVHPKTGRTNQIRLHLAEAGYPIVGDLSYQSEEASNPKATFVATSNTLCLHAAKITICHPITNDLVTFSSPLPDWALDRS